MAETELTVLLVEDDPAIASTVQYALERGGIKVIHCDLMQSALRYLSSPESTLCTVVLDLGLPDGNGLDVCKWIRQHSKCQDWPILILSAQSEEIDRVLGLELGADDYLSKPFSPRELLARVRALQRRVRQQTSHHNAIKAGPVTILLSIDFEGQTAQFNGTPLSLTRLEFGLLQALHSNLGKIRSREQLLRAVWGFDANSTERTVDTHIKTLRAKLAIIRPDLNLITTHRGMGYALHLPESMK